MIPVLKNNTLFQQFVFSLTITILIPVLIIGVISYNRSSYKIERLANTLIEQSLEGISNQFDKMIEEYDNLLAHITIRSEVRQFTELNNNEYSMKFDFYYWMEHSTILEEMFLRTPSVSGVVIAGDAGSLYALGNNRAPQNVDFLYNEAMLRGILDDIKSNMAPDGAMKVFTTRITGKDGDSGNTNTYFITITKRILSTPGLKPVGVMVLFIDTASVTNKWSIGHDGKSNTWIIDSNDSIVYQSGNKYSGRKASEVLGREYQTLDKNSFKYILDGKEQYFASRISQRTGWMFLQSIAVDELISPITSLRNVIIFTCLFAIPLAVFVGYLFIRSIIRPIRKLQRAMKEAGNENWIMIDDVLPNHEINELLNSYNRMVKKISDLIETVYKVKLNEKAHELAVKKSEFQALQTQINPHFLYNTLGTINSYAIVADDTPIQEMVGALGAMFRYAVQNPIEPVSLADEIKHVENYLLIQKYRQDVMPQIIIDVGEYLQYPVLRLSLQPLIENVFQHAFEKGIKPYHKIIIKAICEKEFFVIQVEDNGKGFTSDAIDKDYDKYLGIGLKNVHRRVQIAYGDKYGLSIGKGKMKGAIVSVKFPLTIDEILFK